MWKIRAAFGFAMRRSEARNSRAVAALNLVAAAFLSLAAVALARPTYADEGQSQKPEDMRVVEQCLALAAANRAAQEHTRGVEMPEPVNPEARLRAAAQDARQTPESCIGAVSRPCAGPEGKASDGQQIACLNRELDVWDTRLNETYRRVISHADPDARLRFVKVQRAWLMWRDASCAQPNVVFQGTMAAPMQAQCLLDATARQAIWLGAWEDH